MLHPYLSLPSSDIAHHRLVSAILDLDADIGLVQAEGGDDEMARQVTSAHIAACDGLVAVISGEPDTSQIHDVEQANEMGIPVWLLSDGATVDVVGDRPSAHSRPRRFSNSSTESPAGREHPRRRAVSHRLTPVMGGGLPRPLETRREVADPSREVVEMADARIRGHPGRVVGRSRQLGARPGRRLGHDRPGSLQAVRPPIHPRRADPPLLPRNPTHLSDIW